MQFDPYAPQYECDTCAIYYGIRMPLGVVNSPMQEELIMSLPHVWKGDDE